MKKNELPKAASVRGGIRVRHYIINIIYKNPMSSVMIPSSPQLAKMFGLARSTVSLELKQLIEEGFLIGRRGIGTFTNPKAAPVMHNASERKVIGILYGDGRNFFFDDYAWSIQSYIGLELLTGIGNPRGITLMSADNESIYQELNQMSLDGIIWIAPRGEQLPLLRRFSEAGMPLVTCDRQIDGISGVGIDYEQSGMEMAKILVKEKRFRVVWGTVNRNVKQRIDAARMVFAEHDVEFDESLVFENDLEWLKKVEDQLKQGMVPDAFYAHGEWITPILELLNKYKIDTVSQCRVIAANQSIRDKDNFKGIVYTPPFEKVGCNAAQMMGELLNNPDSQKEHRLLKAELSQSV